MESGNFAISRLGEHDESVKRTTIETSFFPLRGFAEFTSAEAMLSASIAAPARQPGIVRQRMLCHQIR
jgi:hypothetical protein